MSNTRTKRPRKAPTAANGHYQGPIPPSQAVAALMPRIEVWVPLADEYPGWEFLLWRNHPVPVRQQLMDAQTDPERRQSIMRLARAHNGWRYLDDDGQECDLPPMDTDAFWDIIPNEVASAIFLRIRVESIYALPNSLTAKLTSSAASSDTPPSAEAPADSEVESPGPTSDES